MRSEWPHSEGPLFRSFVPSDIGREPETTAAETDDELIRPSRAWTPTPPKEIRQREGDMAAARRPSDVIYGYLTAGGNLRR